MFTLFIFHIVSTAPVAAITVGVAAGATSLLSGVSMAMWVLKKMKKKADTYELSRLEKDSPLCSLLCF